MDWNPDDSAEDFYETFPNENGKVDVQGVIYNYISKRTNLRSNNLPYMGPFQIRNTDSWDDPFNSDREGTSYQGGKAIEITQFNWWAGSGHINDFTDCIIASSSGYCWKLDQSLWKVWITTGGAVVWLRNRARHYAEEMPDYYADGNDKIYITDGMAGVTAKNVEENDYSHGYGAFVYVDNDDSVSIHGFSAISGLHDQSVQTLLDKFCKIAGTQAKFIGDEIIDSEVISNGEDFAL
jgi:hypothetical protein